MAAAVVDLHVDKAIAVLTKLGQHGIFAQVRALNRSIGSARTLLSREVSRDMGLRVSVVKDRIRVQEATQTSLRARLSTSAKRVPLAEFSARGPMPSRGRGRGVTARLPGGRGRYPHAFLARMASGHVGVFERSPTRKMRGRARRQAIYELFGPSIAHVAAKHVAPAIARGELQLAKNLVSELRFAMREAGVRAVDVASA